MFAPDLFIFVFIEITAELENWIHRVNSGVLFIIE